MALNMGRLDFQSDPDVTYTVATLRKLEEYTVPFLKDVLHVACETHDAMKKTQVGVVNDESNMVNLYLLVQKEHFHDGEATIG